MTQYVTIEQMDGWAELTGVDARQVLAASEATLDALWLQLAEQRQEAWLLSDEALLDAIDELRDYVLAELASRAPALEDVVLDEGDLDDMEAVRAAERAWSNCYTDHISMTNPLEW